MCNEIHTPMQSLSLARSAGNGIIARVKSVEEKSRSLQKGLNASL